MKDMSPSFVLKIKSRKMLSLPFMTHRKLSLFKILLENIELEINTELGKKLSELDYVILNSSMRLIQRKRLVLQKDLCLFFWEPECHFVVILTTKGAFTSREDSHFFLKIAVSSIEEIKNILLLGSLYFNNVKKNILTRESKNNHRTNSHDH